MIIKMTVGDNDFTDILESFASVLFFAETGDRTDENFAQLYKDCQEFSRLWNEVNNGSGSLTKDERKNFLDICKRKFVHYVCNRFDDEEETRAYLLQNFRVSMQKSLTPRWQNGEVVYVFIGASGKSITL